MGLLPRPWPKSSARLIKDAEPTVAPLARRSFLAGAVNRLTASWSTQNTPLDYDLRASLKPMRARSRHLAQNSDYAKRFLQMCSTHIVGPGGFSLQIQARFLNGQVDSQANEAIEDAFCRWAERGICEITGRLSFVDLQQLLIETAARDGEFLVRKVIAPNNPFNFTLQVLDVDRLDVDRNEAYADGRRVVMGVELSPAGSPLAYWMLRGNLSASDWQPTGRWERVPVSEVYHGFRATRPEQTRGYPWLHTAMLRLQHLAGFEEAALVAARVGASKMGWFVRQDGGTPTAEQLADGKGSDGVPYMEAEPGAFGMLPEGVDFKPFEPDYPHAAFDPFVKATLRGIASGLGVAYHTLANDLEGVNFSSARAGTLEERDNWMALQSWFADSFLYPLFADWLRQAMLAGEVTYANGTPLPLANVARYTRPIWQGRRWQWVDPLKDVQANVEAIKAGLKSRRDVIAEQGRDIDDVWLQLQKEQQLAEELDLELDGKQDAAPAAKQDAADAAKSPSDGSDAGDGRSAREHACHQKLISPESGMDDFSSSAKSVTATVQEMFSGFADAIAEASDRIAARISAMEQVSHAVADSTANSFVELVRRTTLKLSGAASEGSLSSLSTKPIQSTAPTTDAAAIAEDKNQSEQTASSLDARQAADATDPSGLRISLANDTESSSSPAGQAPTVHNADRTPSGNANVTAVVSPRSLQEASSTGAPEVAVASPGAPTDSAELQSTPLQRKQCVEPGSDPLAGSSVSSKSVSSIRSSGDAAPDADNLSS